MMKGCLSYAEATASAGRACQPCGLEEFDLCMKVNVYGPVMMIRAFQPMIVAEQGRIVNIGSVSGALAGPNIPTYVMAKHAIEGLTDSLAAQLAPSAFGSVS